MSAFLGPIHHWLYNKIQLQEKLTQSLAEAFPEEKAALLSDLDAACGQAESRPLTEVIDEGNIHGWLQTQVSIAEARFAKAVTDLLRTDAARIDTMKEVAFRAGTSHSMKTAKTPQMVFQGLNDVLLDGMPCDHVNELVDQTDDSVTWKRSADLHSAFWLNAGGDPKNFDLLRTSWIQGMLDGSDMTFTQEGSTFTIRR